MAVTIKSAHEIELMRESCRLLSLVFDGMEKMIKPGITTAEINQLGDRLIREYGGIPNFLNYDGYPASICVSVNDEVVHGIPSDKRVLQEGDIVSRCGKNLPGWKHQQRGSGSDRSDQAELL